MPLFALCGVSIAMLSFSVAMLIAIAMLSFSVAMLVAVLGPGNILSIASSLGGGGVLVLES